MNGSHLLAALLGGAVGWLLNDWLAIKAGHRREVVVQDEPYIVRRDTYRGTMRRDLLQEAKVRATKEGWQ